MYGGHAYIRDPISGWWEEDPFLCRCIYFDRCGVLLTRLSIFLVSGTLRLHKCDLADLSGVLDFNDRFHQWKDVITVRAFRRFFSCPLRRWRCRKQEKDSDALGSFLSMREWVRLRRCAAGLDKNIITNASFHGTAWHCVTRLYTLDDQFKHQAAYAHTIEYLPIGAIVLPMMSLAPSNVEPAQWLWAKMRLPKATRSKHGWIHPDIIAK